MKYGNRTVYRNTKIKQIYIYSIPILSEIVPAGFSCGKIPDRKGMGKGAEWHNTQFCDLSSTRAIRQDRWKPTTKGRKNSMPAIPTLTPAGVSTTFTLLSRRAEFFKGKPPKEIQAFFQRAANFLTQWVGKENIVSAMVHMDERTPHLHLTFVPLTQDNRLCGIVP